MSKGMLKPFNIFKEFKTKQKLTETQKYAH